MKKTRITALLLALALGAATLGGCGKKNNEVTNDTVKGEQIEAPAGESGTETAQPEGTTEEPVQLGYSDYIWNYSDDEVMFTIGSHPITFAEFIYYAMTQKPYYDNGDESYWTPENTDSYKATIVDQYKQFAGIKLLATEKYKLELTDENIINIDSNFESLRHQYGSEGFAEALDYSFVTADTFKHLLKYDEYSTLLLKASAPDDEVVKYADENYVHVQHVLIGTLDDEGNALPEEEKAKKLELAKEIAGKAKNGEDFYSLVEQYGEDPGMEGNPDGYTFTYGMMVKEFEDESFRLAENEISEPIETSYGYHIIKKLPLDFAAILDENGETYWEILNTMTGDSLTAELQEYVATLPVVYTDRFNELTMQNIGTLKTAE